MVKRRWSVVTCSALVAACNVSPVSPTAGDTRLPQADGSAGDAATPGDAALGDAATTGDAPLGDAATAGDAGACPSALVVASSDYTSTNVSVLTPTGGAASESILSSGSAPPGLSTALSGDVVLPVAPTPGEVVLIDRYPNAVLTFVDPSSRAVRQMSVSTGFASNPHDYVQLSANKAYVTRYESNPNAGQSADDGGGDLLVIDPQALTITGRVPFPTEGSILPRPDRMLLVGGELWVALGRVDANFMNAGDGRVVGVSTADDTITWTLDLPGLANCGAMARAPAGDVVAVSCAGQSTDPDPASRSAIVLVDPTVSPPVEKKRFSAASLAGAPLAPSLVAFASDSVLVAVALGDVSVMRDDVAVAIDLAAGSAHVLLDAGAPFALGDVHCAPGCTDLCMLADAQAKALRVWKATGSSLVAQAPVNVDPSIGLPPRYIGAF